MPTIETAEEISEIAFGFMGSKALFSALHINLFGALANGGMDLAALSKALDVPLNRVTTLVTALTSMGLVLRDGNTVINSPAADAYLAPDADGYFGDYLRYQIDRQMYPIMGQLDAVLEGRDGDVMYDSYETWMDDPKEAELFSVSQHSGSLGPGAVLAKIIDFSDCTSLLDVGGGTGAFSIMACKRAPDLRATVLDFENVIEEGQRFVSEAGLQDRITFMAGNALEADWPDGQDAILMSYICGGVPREGIPTLFEKAYAALNSGGRLIIHDFMVENDRTGPSLAALWALQHMCYTPDGIALTPGLLSENLVATGFPKPMERDLIPQMTRLLVTAKP